MPLCSSRNDELSRQPSCSHTSIHRPLFRKTLLGVRFALAVPNENRLTTKKEGTPHRLRVWLGLLGWIVFCFAAAMVGTAFPPDDWYAQLTRPEFAPPNYLFGPVWTVLYLCMAVSAWQVWKSDRLAETWKPLLVFILQLALNASWTWLFFGLHRMDWALFEIVLLLAAILVTIVVFWRRHRAAAYLLLPYVLWVVFATALNFEYWRLNR